MQRLSKSLRDDDDVENIKRSIETLASTTAQVLERYDTRNKVVRIRSDDEEEKVFERLVEVLRERGAKM